MRRTALFSGVCAAGVATFTWANTEPSTSQPSPEGIHESGQSVHKDSAMKGVSPPPSEIQQQAETPEQARTRKERRQMRKERQEQRREVPPRNRQSDPLPHSTAQPF